MGFLSLMDAKWDLNKQNRLWFLSGLRTTKRGALQFPLQGASGAVQSWGSLSSPPCPVPLQMCHFPMTQRVAIPDMELVWQDDGTQHGGEERGVWPSPWHQSALANGMWQLVPRLLHAW